ncbi:helix-turn-helix domain-containing protein [Thalassomonas viridans]|uniref:Helix-turn-helix domain-containing protein n=1 Tax=Thalassomonas viridans TaxID=137584 RepID=A0AAE9Z5L1_9GAMM|nr:helix-turn-helix transcriptional regulator [Thalassomonas viridans]WDE07181.1 helix-turn-helix domain-containing protein [Thalassomonas viridans]
MKKYIATEHGQIVAKALTAMRDKAGFSQRELAKKLKKANSFVAHCELGQRRVDIAEFFWICQACGASPQKEIKKIMQQFAKAEARSNKIIPFKKKDSDDK